MQDELNIQIHKHHSWDEIRGDDVYFHYLFPMLLAGKHGFRSNEIRSYQLDLRGKIEVIASPTQFFPRLRDTTTDISQRTRTNVLARNFWDAVKEEFDGQMEKNLVSILYILLMESVDDNPLHGHRRLSAFREKLSEEKGNGLEEMTAQEVVGQMQRSLIEFEEEIDGTALGKDLEAWVDQRRSTRFKEGVRYFWDPDAPTGGMVLVNAKMDYMVVLWVIS